MPELPEVETIARALAIALRGKVVRSAAFYGKMRQPFDADVVTRVLKGRAFSTVRRRAKYMVMEFGCHDVLLAHLGMTGYFHLEKSSRPLHKHDRMGLCLSGGEDLRYADARRFGFVVLSRVSAVGGFPEELAALGVEPLERAFNVKDMLRRAQGRATPIKVFVMDQSVVVGVGNIYASEALFAAGIDPRRAAGSLDADEWKCLVGRIKAVLRGALKAGGSTIRNYRTVDGGEGNFQRVLKIYGKTEGTCVVCGGGVQVIRQGGRSTFFCPNCQT